MRTIALAAAFSWLPIAAAAAAAPAEPVDLALVLAVDVSQSMDRREQQIQRDGYVRAFRSPDVVGAITAGALGRIAITYLEWASETQQYVIVPWTLIDSSSAAARFADALAAAPLHTGNLTSISEALLTSASLLDDSGYEATRRAIDVSGDGPNNDGRSVTAARDTVLSRNLTINGLPIFLRGESDVPDIDQYYSHCVIGGPNAFLFTINDLSQLPAAIERKLRQEIAFLPSPPRLPIVRVQGGSYLCDDIVVE